MDKKFKSKTKLITIVGPTSSGKSDVAVLMAKAINGEIISADSRQVYVGMNIGTGKVTKKEMSGIKHHMLDIANPKQTFTVSDFKKLAENAINEIISKEKIPLICGGTGLYARVLIKDIQIPNVPPNKKLRKELKEKTTEELYLILKKLDERTANNIDKKNPVRLIRAIEISKSLGRVPEIKKNEDKFETLEIGLYPGKEILAGRIKKRLLKRMSMGMISEVKKLKEKGISWKRLNELGLEYRYISRFLKGELTKKEMLEKLEQEIIKFSKRQMTWFKKDKNIKWFRGSEDTSKIIKLAKEFSSKNS